MLKERTWNNSANYSKTKVEVDQDSRAGGHGSHLLPKTHQKYICMWNNSYRKPTGDWQKISHTSKAARKSPPNQVIVYQPWQLCFRMPAGQTWRQASDCVQVCCTCLVLGPNLKGHASWGVVFPIVIQENKGISQTKVGCLKSVLHYVC